MPRPSSLREAEAALHHALAVQALLRADLRAPDLPLREQLALRTALDDLGRCHALLVDAYRALAAADGSGDAKARRQAFDATYARFLATPRPRPQPRAAWRPAARFTGPRALAPPSAAASAPGYPGGAPPPCPPGRDGSAGIH